MAGTANRLGIIAFRMMMILATLRYFESSTGNANTIICEQIDFDNALRIVNKLEKHAVNVMEYLNGQPDQKELARLLHNQAKSYGEISETIFGSKGHKGTVYKWLNKNISTKVGNGGNALGNDIKAQISNNIKPFPCPFPPFPYINTTYPVPSTSKPTKQ